MEVLPCGHTADLVNYECPVCDELLTQVDNAEWVEYQLGLALAALNQAYDYSKSEKGKKAISVTITKLELADREAKISSQELRAKCPK
jgi:hypothetical protein